MDLHLLFIVMYARARLSSAGVNASASSAQTPNTVPPTCEVSCRTCVLIDQAGREGGFAARVMQSCPRWARKSPARGRAPPAAARGLGPAPLRVSAVRHHHDQFTARCRNFITPLPLPITFARDADAPAETSKVKVLFSASSSRLRTSGGRLLDKGNAPVGGDELEARPVSCPRAGHNRPAL